MAQAIRTLTVEKGIEPRDFALVAFGGAGPMHAVFLARELGIREVLVRASRARSRPGGCSRREIRQDASARLLHAARRRSTARSSRRCSPELEDEGFAALDDEGVSARPAASTRPGPALRGPGVHADRPAAERRRAARGRTSTGALSRPLRRGARHALRPCEPRRAGRARHRALDRARRHRARRAVALDGGERRRTRPRPRRVRSTASAHDTVDRTPRRPPAAPCSTGPAVVSEDTATTVVPPGATAASTTIGTLVVQRRRGGLMATVGIDPITTEIIRSAFNAAADDMNATLIRSAYTPIIYEMKDCSVALLDADHRVLGQSAGLPIFLGNLEICTRLTEETYGREAWRPGDVWIMNDSLPDRHAPQRHDGLRADLPRRTSWSASPPAARTGSTSAPRTPAARWTRPRSTRRASASPPLTVVDGGEQRRDVVDMLARNCASRTRRRRPRRADRVRAHRPGAAAGDHRPLRARRPCSRPATRSSPRPSGSSATAIAAIPDGVYEAEGCLDDDGVEPGEPSRSACGSTVAGRRDDDRPHRLRRLQARAGQLRRGPGDLGRRASPTSC